MLERVMPTRAGLCNAANKAVNITCKVTSVALKVADWVAVAAIGHKAAKDYSPIACPEAVRDLSTSGDYLSIKDFALPVYVTARFVMMVAANTFGHKQQATEVASKDKKKKKTT